MESGRRGDNRVGKPGNQVWQFENEKKKIVNNEGESGGAGNAERKHSSPNIYLSKSNFVHN